MTKKSLSQECKLILIFNRGKSPDKTPHLFMIKAVNTENNFNLIKHIYKKSTANLMMKDHVFLLRIHIVTEGLCQYSRTRQRDKTHSD